MRSDILGLMHWKNHGNGDLSNILAELFFIAIYSCGFFEFFKSILSGHAELFSSILFAMLLLFFFPFCIMAPVADIFYRIKDRINRKNNQVEK